MSLSLVRASSMVGRVLVCVLSPSPLPAVQRPGLRDWRGAGFSFNRNLEDGTGIVEVRVPHRVYHTKREPQELTNSDCISSRMELMISSQLQDFYIQVYRSDVSKGSHMAKIMQPGMAVRVIPLLQYCA
ncbi:hypothetical protein CABS01_12889 [Colletotrichum abscissum]|uniref:uncharacterized protein n=1 Tax=Colletotrichum abscissum TaxID=1671311 RepID=UPI0027D64A83|nr:uncharacterized protein CABS01_12889 [Colletotrichum abscissum]KAK1487410.1 hypothetical protein CABS01_12889 [Colletotrichum abscissum]